MPTIRDFTRLILPSVGALALLAPGARAAEPEPSGAPKTAATGAERFEAPPTLKAKDALDPELLQGPHHKVQDRVVNDGVSNSFVIESDYGTFEAGSRELAELRIAEIASIAGLQELSSSKMFADALAGSVKQKADTVAKVVTDPGATVKGAGKGLKRMFGKSKEKAEEVAEKVTTDGEAGGSGATDPAQQAADAGKDLLGVSKAKRQIAKSVGADPYSTNPVLQQELGRLANAAVAGGVTGGLGVRVPGVDAVASMGSLAWDLPPEDLRARNEKALKSLGCDAATMKRFFANPVYTPTLATALVGALEALEGVAERGTLVALAAGAEDELEARFYRSSLALLAGASSDGLPLKQALAYGRAPAALASDGTLVVAAAADQLIWTEGLAEAAERTIPGAGARMLRLTGRLSDLARSEFQARGWTVREGVEAPAPGLQ